MELLNSTGASVVPVIVFLTPIIEDFTAFSAVLAPPIASTSPLTKGADTPNASIFALNASYAFFAAGESTPLNLTAAA